MMLFKSFTLLIPTWSEPNTRRNPFARARVVKSQRAKACVGVMACMTRTERSDFIQYLRDAPQGRVSLVIQLTRLSPRRLDSDNLAGALKAVRDGIADALCFDDGDLRVRWDYHQVVAPKACGVMVCLSTTGSVTNSSPEGGST